jgi:CRP-like cAMP-binding protein
MEISASPGLGSAQIDFLRTVPLFALLNDDDLAVLVDDFQLKKYARDQIIFQQGDTSRRLYVIVRGKVRIFKLSPGGHETSINIFSTRDVIGEFATIDNQPRSATAKAISRCNLLEIDSQRFLAHFRQVPDLALGLARTLAAKVRWTASFAETVAQYDAAGRLLHTLLLYKEQLGEEIEPGQQYILDLSLNQTDLASLIGARREWVNRLMRDWKKRGLIEYKGGKIFILDLPGVIRERDSRIEAYQSGT